MVAGVAVVAVAVVAVQRSEAQSSRGEARSLSLPVNASTAVPTSARSSQRWFQSSIELRGKISKSTSMLNGHDRISRARILALSPQLSSALSEQETRLQGRGGIRILHVRSLMDTFIYIYKEAWVLTQPGINSRRKISQFQSKSSSNSGTLPCQVWLSVESYGETQLMPQPLGLIFPQTPTSRR